ncbi:MAG: helix-turn-helix transcriptional regulator [Clostridiaceae bacterium]|nr:helix-turn-helix transcriptional regulator [Clostridiaceae bacterium]
MSKYNKSVIYKWLLSYIAILILPLIIFTASMMKFLTVYEDEIKYSNSLILEQARMKMDQALHEANTFISEISIEPMIQRLLAIKDKSEVSAYDLYQATTTLNRLMLTTKEQFEFLIYFPRPDIAITNYSYNNSEDFYHIYISQYGLPQNLWDNIINNKYSSTVFFSYEDKESSGKTITRIIMVSPIMLAKHNSMYANILIFLDESLFLNYKNQFFGRGTFLIIDNENNVLYKSGDMQINDHDLDYTMFEPGLNSLNMTLSREKVIASHTSSSASKLKYIILMEEKTYLAKFNVTKNTMIISIILCCVVGGITIYYLLRQNYSPLKSVVKSIEDSAMRLAGSTMNEFQYISQTIKQLQHEKKATSDIIKQQTNTLKSQLVLSLVENRDAINEVDLHMLEKYDIRFQSDLFLVLTFLVYDGEGPFPNDNEVIDDREKNKMIRLIFQNITEELLGEKNMKAYFFHIGRLIGFIINPQKENEDVILETVAEKIDQITNSINKYFLIRFVSACSNIHKSWKNIPAAYSEALQVIEYNSMLNMDKVVFYHELVNLPMEQNFYYPVEMENHIINNLKIGNEQAVIETIEKVINLNIENNSTPVTIRYLVVNIVGTIIKVINQLEKKKYNFPQLSFQALLQENNLNVMCSEIEKNVHVVCKLIREQSSEKNKLEGAALHKQCIAIVKSKFNDKNLNVSMIADKLGVHVVNLSRTFMEYEGQSLSNYINSMRLKEAKKLILAGHKLETVSERVGYGSLRTFMRVFKKSEGITPGQFKEAMEKELCT